MNAIKATMLLYTAISYNDAAKAAEALDAGALVNYWKSTSYLSPLHEASVGDRAQIVRLLLDKGADVNAQDQCGNSPLHHAAHSGSINTICALLDGGADTNVVNDDAQIPIDVARKRHRPDVIALLSAVRAAGADPSNNSRVKRRGDDDRQNTRCR